MRVNFNEWWLIPLGILTVSVLVAVGVVFVPSFVGHSSAEVARQAASEASTDCSGALASDYACHQERYRNLVLDSGVEAAFADLKDEYKKNEFVRSGCHQMTHIIGRAAAERYGDVAGAYAWGEHFCGTGYYHGVMETVVARIGPDGIQEVADMLCAGLREQEEHSAYHSGCAHGLGHGFMGVLENELFESLYACDGLTDGWEREHCYNGVFMENLPSNPDQVHPSKYLKVDEPLYPCTDVEDRYKKMCYAAQMWYVLTTQGDDFTATFELCATAVEEEFRPVCYKGLGSSAAGHSIKLHITEAAQIGSTERLCALGPDDEAISNCIDGAVGQFIYHYRADTQAKAFCETLGPDLRSACLQATEEFYNPRSAGWISKLKYSVEYGSQTNTPEHRSTEYRPFGDRCRHNR